MTKVVNKDMLVECLEAAQILQLILKHDTDLIDFDRHWKKNPTFRMGVLNELGLYHETIELGKELEFHENDSEMLYHFGGAYIHLKQFARCLEMHERIKSLVIVKDSSHKIAHNELFCLYSLGQFELVKLKTDALLKTDLKDDMWENFLILNAYCSLDLEEYHNCLRTVRNWWKKFPLNSIKINKVYFYQGLLHIMFFIKTALLGVDRLEQSFHWALEGMNLVDLLELTDYHYFFDDAINFHKINPTVEVFDFSERPTPVQTTSFISIKGKRCYKLELPAEDADK